VGTGFIGWFQGFREGLKRPQQLCACCLSSEIAQSVGNEKAGRLGETIRCC
jgi:hypothetical protein